MQALGLGLEPVLANGELEIPGLESLEEPVGTMRESFEEPCHVEGLMPGTLPEARWRSPLPEKDLDLWLESVEEQKLRVDQGRRALEHGEDLEHQGEVRRELQLMPVGDPPQLSDHVGCCEICEGLVSDTMEQVVEVPCDASSLSLRLGDPKAPESVDHPL